MRVCPHCRTENEECNEATVTTPSGPMRIIGCRDVPRDATPYLLDARALMFGPPTQPSWSPPTSSAEWRPVRPGGPLHWCKKVTERGNTEWRASCGLWANDGYEKVDDPVHGRGTLRCRDCKRRAEK